MEQVTRKTANYLSEVLEDQREKLLENLTANGMDLATYLTRFQWDMAKYPIKQSLRNLTDIISEYYCTGIHMRRAGFSCGKSFSQVNSLARSRAT